MASSVQSGGLPPTLSDDVLIETQLQAVDDFQLSAVTTATADLVEETSGRCESFEHSNHTLKPESLYIIDEETRMGPDNTNDVTSPDKGRIPTDSSNLKSPEGLVNAVHDAQHPHLNSGNLGKNTDINSQTVFSSMSSVSRSDMDLSSDSVAKFAVIAKEHSKYFTDTEASNNSVPDQSISPPAAPIGHAQSFSALSFIASEYAGSGNSSPCTSDSAQEDSHVPTEIAPIVAFEAQEGERPLQDTTVEKMYLFGQEDNLIKQNMSLDDESEKSKPIWTPSLEVKAIPVAVEDEKVRITLNTGDFVKETKFMATSPSHMAVTDVESGPDISSITPQSIINEIQHDQIDQGDGHSLEQDSMDVDMEEASLVQTCKHVKTDPNASDDSKQADVVGDSLLSFQDESLDSVVPGEKIPGPLTLGENANDGFTLPVDKLILEGEDSVMSGGDWSLSNKSQDGQPRPKRPCRASIANRVDQDEDEDGLNGFPAERVFEYQWPQDGGEWYLLQEQISEYLGIKSFKRKYPDLMRRTCDKTEKDFLREKGVVTETQSDLGLTALRSDEVYDLMMKDYPEKYQEYAAVLHERQKQTISDKHKEYEVSQPKLEKSKMADYMKKAAKSAADYNLHFQRERRDERCAYFDLQTFMIQYPLGRYRRLPPEHTKPSSYPVALIPGQFQEHYCSYTSDELRYFPINTTLFDPPKKMKTTLAKPSASSESSSEDSSEDKNGSTSSDGSQDTGGSDSEAPAIPPPATPIQTPSKASAKKVVKKPLKVPTNKTPKSQSKSSAKNLNNGSGPMIEPAELVCSTPPPTPTVPGEKVQEESEDKCRICKNAAMQTKSKKPETRMIKCSECGRIAHPSCLDLTDKMVQVISTYPWQCMECKTCVECMDPYDEDKMLFCDRCDRGYHTFCVGLRSLPTGRWECRSCKGTAETPKARRGRPLKS